MSNEDYSYTNDLDEGGVLSTMTRRCDQNHSPLAQVITEVVDSHVNYEYLDDNNSLSAGFDDDFEDVQAALALEDFVGVGGSDLQSDLFESNSVFGIGDDEPGTQTPSGASQQSVSGTDFDTLPIAPIAKRPIEAPPPSRQPAAAATTSSVTRRNNAPNSSYGNQAADVPNLTAALVGLTDIKAPMTPFKLLDFYGISSPSAPPSNGLSLHPQQHLNGSSAKHGRGNNDHALNSKHGSGVAGSSIGPYGIASRVASKPCGADTASRNMKATSGRPAPPVPPALQPSPIANKNDSEGFGFGIETLLHGTQLGFGRQPSFKRIAPGAGGLTSNTNKPYYLMPGVPSEGNSTAIEVNQPGAAARAPGGNDRNAEAFSTWLEALDPKTNSQPSLPRTVRGAAAYNNTNTSAASNAAGPSVGEDFKREVDVMMKDLLGDYDLTGGMAGVFAPNNSVASGLPAPPGSSTTTTATGGGVSGGPGGTLSGQRGSLLTGSTNGGAAAARQLEYDAFLKDVRLLTPTVRSPKVATGLAATTTTSTSGEKWRPLAKGTKSAVATVGPNPIFAVQEERKPSPTTTTTTTTIRSSQIGTATAAPPKSILNTSSPVGSARAAAKDTLATPATGNTASPSQDAPRQQQQQQQQSSLHDPQPPGADGAQGRRRRVWSSSVPARSSGEGISGAALDPSTEAETVAEPPKLAHRLGSEGTTTAHQTPPPPPSMPSSATGLRPAAVNRIPRPAAPVVAALAVGESPARVKASFRQPSSPCGEHNGKEALLCPDSGVYGDMDEDLLAGGYLTGGPIMRSTESLFDGSTPSKKHEEEAVVLVPSSSPKDEHADGVAPSSSSHGRRFSSMEGHIGASVLRQRWHPSWKKNGPDDNAPAPAPASSTKPPEQKASNNSKAVATPSSPNTTAPSEGSSTQPQLPLSNGGLVARQTSPSSSAATETETESAKAAASQRRASIPSFTANRTPMSVDAGTQANPLPVSSFTPNRVTHMDSLRVTSTNRTSPLQRDSVRKGASAVTIDSVSKASRRASTSPSTAEPIVLAERERSGFLQRVSARSSDRDVDEAELSTAHNPPQQPRRRLMEFRGGGDATLPPTTSRSRISCGTTAEEARAEAARQREREREIQQANEERRQRIQAFMAKRKAEKQMEELRRGQLMERDRQVEAFREEQERQRIQEVTAPEAASTALPPQHQQQQQQHQTGAVAGSGFNAIKASQRMRRPTLDRPLHPSVVTASFIPESSTVPMSPQQPQLPNGELLTSAGGPRRKQRNGSPSPTTSVGATKAKIRSVVVFISSNNSAVDNKPGTAKDTDKCDELRRLSTSSAASTAVYEGTSVVMELNDADHMLKVQQPQERTRYFNVDEFVLISDSNPCALSKSSERGGGGGVTSSHNSASALRNAAAAQHRRLISLTLTEMNRKFLAGVNVALLLGSTENAQDAAILAIREVVEGVVSHMPAQSQLFVSVAYLVGGNTEDLLSDPPRSMRSTFSTSPLFGLTLDDVCYVPVAGVGHLLRTIADAYKRGKGDKTQQEAGLLVISLLLKQRRDADVILSSYLITDVGCDGGIYTAVLRKSQHAPFALFHSALGGPTLTTTLMAADAADVTTVVPLLNIQHRLSAVLNKPCHVGSVQRFMELAQRELDTADGGSSKTGSPPAVSNTRSNSTGNGSRRTSGSSLSNTVNSNSKLSNAGRQQVGASRLQIHKRLAEQVAMAKQILKDPEGYLPKGVPRPDKERSASATMRSAPSTEPPSATTAPLTQLTKKQEDEAQDLHLTSGMSKRKVSNSVPATAAAAVAAAANSTRPAAAAAAGETTGTKTTAATNHNHHKKSSTSCDGIVALPSIASGASPAAAAARTPPMVSAVPLKHPGAASAEAPSAPPPGRRSSNNTAAGVAAVAAASRDAQGASIVRQSRNTTEDAPLAASKVRASRNAGMNGGASFPRQQSVTNEQSVSASAEYVQRGRVDDAVQRNTGFMNLEDSGTSQSLPTTGKGTASNTQQQQQQRRNPSRMSEYSELPPRPATTMAPASDFAKVTAQDSFSAARRRVSADGGRPSLGLQLFAPPGLQQNGGGGVPPGKKKLLPGATTIGSNGPQWPSTPAFEIPTIPSVASIDTSFTHDVSISMRQSLNAYEGEKAPIPTSTKVRTLVIVDSRCRETSNVTYDNTMVIATTEDDFEEYDVDEVREATPGQKELIQAELLKELCDTLLMGCNAAILGADSRPTGFSAQVLKSVVHSIFAEMNREGTHRSGRLSTSIVKVKGESVVDLLKDSGEAQKLVIAISPLFGSCVHGVTYADVASGAAFNDIIDTALSRASSHDNSRDYGFLFCSLLFKLRLEDEGDVQVCSLVTTFAGENVGLYTSVLDRSPLVPRALFHYALGGPSYTIALLGIGSEETRANQMLQVQKRLGEMSNRATHPGSVAKFVAGIRNDLTPNLIAKYENSRDPSERAATKEMIERLAEMVKDADALLDDFDHHQPKAYLHGDAEQQENGTANAKSQPLPQSQSQRLRSTPLSVPPTATNASGDSSANTNSKNGQSSDASVSSPQSTPTPARPAAQRALPSITAVNPDAEGERIQSLVCFEQVMMGAGTVAVQGNSILCASQGGMRFDSDEVITCDENHRSLSSKLMDELVSKFLSGHHTGLLAADSTYSAFTPLMLRHIANNILEAVLGGSAGGQEDNGFAFTKPPTISGELQVSIALIKDDVTADLLPIDVDATYHRFEMEHTPLYGPRVVGVTPHLVANPQDFDHFLAVAIDNADPALQTADPGIMVVSLVLTQRVTKPVEDVLVSSLLCTAVFDAVHHYERVLEGNPSEPLDLFKNVLRGPCFSVALLGISDEEEDPGKLLRALNDLSQVRNRAPQVNSVSRHIRELQRGIVKLKERMTTSSNEDEKAYIQSRVEMAEKLLEEAESLQRNPLSLMQPRAFVPLGGAADLH